MWRLIFHTLYWETIFGAKEIRRKYNNNPRKECVFKLSGLTFDISFLGFYFRSIWPFELNLGLL